MLHEDNRGPLSLLELSSYFLGRGMQSQKRMGKRNVSFYVYIGNKNLAAYPEGMCIISSLATAGASGCLGANKQVVIY